MKTPWHVWVVGVVTLVFNAGGAVDYVMTQTRNDAYMAQFTPEQLAYFYGFPTWVVACWALAVWSAVLASACLLLRRRWAVYLFGLSLITMAATALHNFVLSEVSFTQIVGPEALVFSAVIALVTLASWLYSRKMAARGVLK